MKVRELSKVPHWVALQVLVNRLIHRKHGLDTGFLKDLGHIFGNRDTGTSFALFLDFFPDTPSSYKGGGYQVAKRATD